MASEYRIQKHLIETLHRQAYAAQQEAHLEVCGVLVGRSRDILELRYVTNVKREPYTHSMRRTDVEEIESDVATTGLSILGTFHSHPVSEARPSGGDIAGGFCNGMELIYDVCGEQARLWRLVREGGIARAVEERIDFVRDR